MGVYEDTSFVSKAAAVATTTVASGTCIKLDIDPLPVQSVYCPLASLSRKMNTLYLVHVELAHYKNKIRQERDMGMGLVPFYSSR